MKLVVFFGVIMEKKLFVNFNCAFNTHFETELELMLKNLKQGNEVYSLYCDGKLNRFCACSYNNSDKMLCDYCQAKYKKGIELIGLQKENCFSIAESSKYPEFLSCNFKSLDELTAIKFNNIDIGDNVVRTYNNLMCLQISNINDISQKFIYNSLNNSINVLNTFILLFNKIKFSSIYFFSGRFPEYYSILSYCKNHNITFYVHDRGANYNKYCCFKNSYFNNFETMIDNWVRMPLVQYKENGDNLKIGSQWFESRIAGSENAWISFSKKQVKNNLPENFSNQNFNVTIFNSSSHEVVIDDTRLSSECFRDEIAIIKKICDKFKTYKEYKFYLRCHPNIGFHKGSQYSRLLELKCEITDNLTVIMPEESIDSYSLVKNSDIVIVSMNSTVGAEAAFMGKPVILLGKALYQELDIAYRPKNFNELFNLLADKAIKAKPKINALKYGYCMATYGIDFQYYEPIGLFEGTFMGVNLNKSQKFLPLKGKIKRFYYKQKASLKKRIFGMNN